MTKEMREAMVDKLSRILRELNLEEKKLQQNCSIATDRAAANFLYICTDTLQDTIDWLTEK